MLYVMNRYNQTSSSWDLWLEKISDVRSLQWSQIGNHTSKRSKQNQINFTLL